MDFNINKETRKMLELFAQYAVLRRLAYSLIFAVLVWKFLDILPAIIH